MNYRAWLGIIVVLLSPLAHDGGSVAASSAEGGAPGDWMARVQADMQAREYEVSWQASTAVADVEPSWHAPNRAQGFRTYFTSDGIRVVSRTQTESPWRWGLSVVGYGRGGTVWAVPEATLSPAGERIDYRRGALQEWYENCPRGLKQWFVLPSPPEEAADAWSAETRGRSTREPGRGRQVEPRDLVHVDLELWGDLSPVIAADGQTIDFVDSTGAEIVRYAELLVTDAGGRALPAWMEGIAGEPARGIRLVVDARDAVYPLTIDPLATSPVWTTESNQQDASLGYSVATAGDVNGDGYSDLIVGAPGKVPGGTPGAAYLYLGGAGGPAATPSWTAAGEAANNYFGWSVATAGDVNGDGYADVIVGAWGNAGNRGKTYVYLGGVGGLASSPAWTADGDAGTGSFGYAVATAGDVNGDGYSDVVVGAWSLNGQRGKAYLYLGGAAGPAATPSWTAEGLSIGERFALSVATAGDVNGDGYADVIVGGYLYDNDQTDEGRAYVYHGSVSGLAASPAWTVEGDQSLSDFGWSVATAGDVDGDGFADVIVGAPRYDNGQTDEGRAFVYRGSSSGLAASPSWTAETNQTDARLGSSVGTAGDINGDGYADVIVGAYLYDNGQANEGRAYLYPGSSSGLSATPAWTAESDQAGASFGHSVATAGDVDGDGFADVIVGASLYDNGQTDEGRAYLYPGSASGPSATAGWTAQSNQSSWLGVSVGTAGDVNGDGYTDVIVGFPLYDNGQSSEGRALVYHGSASGPSSTPGWTAESDQAGALFGRSAGTAGDVNGDGYADVIVGAPFYDNGQTDEGRAFLYLGSSSGLAPAPAWTTEGNQSFAQLGSSVGTAGDVNGDGYADVIVGIPSYDDGQTDKGRAFVYNGLASGLSSTPSWMVEGDQLGANLGIAVGTAGDVNGDGYADVIVGAHGFDNGQADEGRAYVYHGAAMGLSSIASWVAESDQTDAFFGRSVGTAGDVNGDGYADVIVGAHGFDNGQTDEGRAFVYHGSASGLSSMAGWTVESDQAGAFLGYSVGTAGDVNGDGYADVIVGAHGFDNGQTDRGRAFIYNGSASGLSSAPSWMAEGNQNAAILGFAVGTAGDANGDGYADVIVGAIDFITSPIDEGRAFLYYGNGGPGVSLRPQQRRADDAGPIAPQGASDGADGFRLSALGRTPFGRGRVRLQWEVKPLGILFDGNGTQEGPVWIDTGAGGAALNELVAGLQSHTSFHWRLRLLYDPVGAPFQQASRWFTAPINGWQEADLRTAMQADLSVTQTDAEDPVLAGADITYTVSVGNAGPDPVPVGLLDVLPAGASPVSATPSQGSCNAGAGVVNCQLGTLGAGGVAVVTVVVSTAAPGDYTNSVTVFAQSGMEIDTGNNSALETTTAVVPAIGDRVWMDLDGDGIQDSGEPGADDVVVVLYDGGGMLIDLTFTAPDGSFSLQGLTFGNVYSLRFLPPPGFSLTVADQGADDAADSDADPANGRTPAFAVVDLLDRSRWDAGIVPSCVPPDEPIYISMVTMTTDGNNHTILHFQDGNQPAQVTGYNVYRSSVAGPPPASWPLVASDVIDMDEATPNKQWVDASGHVSPTGVWYYNVTAYNSRCPAEGPF